MTKSSIGWLGQTLLVLVGLGWVAAPPSTTQAITVGVQTSDGNPGSSVEVQIILIGGNGLVAGMQTDISWDPSCVSVASGGGDTASCFGNPTIPKNLQTKIQSGSSLLRALFFSMSDVEPIKQDAVLFTCVFNIDPATTATQCPINLSNLVVSDAKGGRLPATAAPGVVRITQPSSQQAAPQGGPALAPAPVIVAPGGAAAGSGGQASGGAPAAAAPASGARGAGNTVVQGLPPGQVPAAEEAAGAAGEAVTTPGLLTPAPAVRTVAAAITPSPKAGTPTAGAKTPTVHATTPPTTRRGTPTAAKSTPKGGAQ